MANTPLQTLTFPGLPNTYTVPGVDATLTATGAAADAKKKGDEITQLKSDFEQITDVTEETETQSYDATSDEVTIETGYYYLSGNGAKTKSDAWSSISMEITENSKVICKVSSTTKYFCIYNSPNFGTETFVAGYYRNNWPNEPITVSAGQYVVASTQNTDPTGRA